jgi:hypothetical protein
VASLVAVGNDMVSVSDSASGQAVTAYSFTGCQTHCDVASATGYLFTHDSWWSGRCLCTGRNGMSSCSLAAGVARPLRRHHMQPRNLETLAQVPPGFWDRCWCLSSCDKELLTRTSTASCAGPELKLGCRQASKLPASVGELTALLRCAICSSR